jgi:N-acetylglucosamine-6-phosphate deacetylase
MTISSPGFVDLQVNGFAGVDFNDPRTSVEDVQRALAAMRATGVTRCLPTLITSPFDSFARCAQTLARAEAAALAGIHMEGPYISPLDGARGAHPAAHVCHASRDDFSRRQDAAGGRIRVVTLAPEAPGALPLIEHLAASGVTAAIGHTAASAEQIREAVRAGARMSTHLGNGCSGVLPRHPNLVWEQLAEDALLASFIVDGHHLPPATVKSMVRAKTPSRTVLVTDAIAAAGCPPGRYSLGGAVVELHPDGRVAPPGASWLAGSSLTLERAVANTVRFTGLSVAEALEMVTTRPAQLLGIRPAGRVELEWDAAAYELRVLRVED